MWMCIAVDSHANVAHAKMNGVRVVVDDCDAKLEEKREGARDVCQQSRVKALERSGKRY